MAIATTSAISYSLRTLRQAVADRFGDLTQLTTTASGSSTTLVDALNVNAGSEHFNGRMLLITSGTYDNHKARITGTTDSSGTLTFTPAAGGTIASGVTADVFNRRGIGFTIGEYDRAINNAIDDAFPLAVNEAYAEVASANVTVANNKTTIQVPDSIYEVYAVEWLDDDDVHRDIPKATRSNNYGWRALPNGFIEITGPPQFVTIDRTLYLRGYNRQDRLTEASGVTHANATCLLNKEWIVARAAYHLALGAVMRGPEYGSLAQQFGRETEMLRTRLRTIRHANSERVRTY